MTAGIPASLSSAIPQLRRCHPERRRTHNFCTVILSGGAPPLRAGVEGPLLQRRTSHLSPVPTDPSNATPLRAKAAIAAVIGVLRLRSTASRFAQDDSGYSSFTQQCNPATSPCHSCSSRDEPHHKSRSRADSAGLQASPLMIQGFHRGLEPGVDEAIDGRKLRCQKTE